MPQKRPSPLEIAESLNEFQRDLLIRVGDTTLSNAARVPYGSAEWRTFHSDAMLGLIRHRGELSDMGRKVRAVVMRMEVCPGCSRARANVGPWDGSGDGGHTRLCGPCKAKRFADSGGHERIRRQLEREFGAGQ